MTRHWHDDEMCDMDCDAPDGGTAVERVAAAHVLLVQGHTPCNGKGGACLLTREHDESCVTVEDVKGAGAVTSPRAAYPPRKDWSVCQTCHHYNDLHGLLRLPNGGTLDPCECCYLAASSAPSEPQP